MLQDRPDAPLVKRLVLGEVPVPARYDAPAPGDGLSRSQHGSGAAGVGFTAPGMPSRASFSALGGSAHGTEDGEKERRVSMFPSVGGGGSGKSDKGGKSGGGGITGLLAGIFSSSKSAKDDKAADGGGGGGGGGALDGLSKRLVNSTRIKVRAPIHLPHLINPPSPPHCVSCLLLLCVGVVCAGGRADAKAVADGGVVAGPRQGRPLFSPYLIP